VIIKAIAHQVIFLIFFIFYNCLKNSVSKNDTSMLFLRHSLSRTLAWFDSQLHSYIHFWWHSDVAKIIGRVGRYHPLHGGADWRSRFL
jgi:hypothetical protein